MRVAKCPRIARAVRICMDDIGKVVLISPLEELCSEENFEASDRIDCSGWHPRYRHVFYRSRHIRV